MLCFAAGAGADSWLAPTEKDYYSAASVCRFHVVPGDGNAHAHGTLFRTVGDVMDEDVDVEEEATEWSVDLENPYSPHKVLVADSGDYVVTFDEWGRVGYGPNVVVIYGPEGEVIKKYDLEDLLTKEEITMVPTTVSSRWWGGDHYLDEDAGELILIVGRQSEPGALTVPSRAIRIRLAGGEILL
jgi:hypothetical protein